MRILGPILLILVTAVAAPADLSPCYIELLSGSYYEPGTPDTLVFKIYNHATDGEAIKDVIIQIESYWVLWVEEETLGYDEIEPGRPSWETSVHYATGCPDYCIAIIGANDNNGNPGEIFPGESTTLRVGCEASVEHCPTEIDVYWWLFGDVFKDGVRSNTSGLFSVGCVEPSPVASGSWGAIKALYRQP